MKSIHILDNTLLLIHLSLLSINFYKMKSIVILVLFFIDGYISYGPGCDYCNHPKACKDICEKNTFWFDVKRIKYICKKYCGTNLTKKCMCENRFKISSFTRTISMEKPNMKLFWKRKPKILKCLDFCTGKNFWTRMTCVLYCLKNLDL